MTVVTAVLIHPWRWPMRAILRFLLLRRRRGTRGDHDAEYFSGFRAESVKLILRNRVAVDPRTARLHPTIRAVIPRPCLLCVALLGASHGQKDPNVGAG